MPMPSTSLPSKSFEKFSPDFVGRIGGSVRLKHVWLRNCNATKLCRVFLNALLFTQYWQENGPTSQPDVLSVEKWSLGSGKLKIVFLFGTAEILEGPYKKKHPEISCLAGRLVSGSWSNIGSSSSSESSFRDTNFRFIPIIMLLPDLASCENSEIIDNARNELQLVQHFCAAADDALTNQQLVACSQISRSDQSSYQRIDNK